MAFELHRDAFPAIAASAIGARQPVKLVDGERRVAPVGSAGERALGFALGSAAIGEGVTVHEDDNYVKAIAGASLGGGAEVMVGSTNGALVLAAGASGAARWAVGQVAQPAAAGGVLTVRVSNRQITGLV